MDIKEIVKNAIDNGFAPVPRFKDNKTGEWKLRKFINNDTGEYGYPLEHKAWNADMPGFSLALCDAVLIDLDANKEQCQYTIDELKIKVCESLGIDEFDLDMALFQENKKGDSLHYMFKLPDSVNFSDIGQSNDGNFIEFVDFKTGRQLVHFKEGKTIHWCNINDLQEFPIDALNVILKPTTKKVDFDEFKTTDETTRYGDAVLRGVNQKATVFVDEGGRNASLAGAVVSVYEFVAGGEISSNDAEKCINEIVDDLGILDENDTLTTIEYNKKKGLNQPKSAPKQAEKIKSILKDDLHRIRAKKALSDADKFITDKLHFKIDVDLDVAHAMLISCFWNPQQNKLNTINDIDEKVIFNEKDINQMLVSFFGNPVKNYDDMVELLNDDDCELKQTEKNAVLHCAINNIVKTIKAYYQRSALEQRVDMFSDRTHFKFTPDKAIEHHKHVRLSPPKGVYDDEQAIKDYTSHFPMVRDVLEMIIGARFASSRKKAYIWLKAPSDWGKDFFRVALGELATEMSVKEVEKAIEGAPVGKSPTDLLRSMVLVTNEFKKVKAELKQLEDGIKLSPKYQLETYVPLYTKLFMSAEGVDSLMGDHGVEAQFANRFSMLEMEGDITLVNSFKRLGGHKFMQAIQTWFCEVLNAEIEKYVAMGVDVASRTGDDVVIAFHNKYGIANGRTTLEDNLGEVADMIKDQLIKRYFVDSYSEGDAMYLQSAKSKIKSVLFDKEIFDPSEAYTIMHKVDYIMTHICSDNVGVKTYRSGNKTIKALKIVITDDFENLETDDF